MLVSSPPLSPYQRPPTSAALPHPWPPMPAASPPLPSPRRDLLCRQPRPPFPLPAASPPLPLPVVSLPWQSPCSGAFGHFPGAPSHSPPIAMGSPPPLPSPLRPRANGLPAPTTLPPPPLFHYILVSMAPSIFTGAPSRPCTVSFPVSMASLTLPSPTACPVYLVAPRPKTPVELATRSPPVSRPINSRTRSPSSSASSLSSTIPSSSHSPAHRYLFPLRPSSAIPFSREHLPGIAKNPKSLPSPARLHHLPLPLPPPASPKTRNPSPAPIDTRPLDPRVHQGQSRRDETGGFSLNFAIISQGGGVLRAVVVAVKL